MINKTKQVTTMSYLQIYDVDPKMCLLYDFFHQNAENSENIGAILYFSNICILYSKKIREKWQWNAQIVPESIKACKIDRHFPAFSFFIELSSDSYIKYMWSITSVKCLKTADIIQHCIIIIYYIYISLFR